MRKAAQNDFLISKNGGMALFQELKKLGELPCDVLIVDEDFISHHRGGVPLVSITVAHIREGLADGDASACGEAACAAFRHVLNDSESNDTWSRLSKDALCKYFEGNYSHLQAPHGERHLFDDDQLIAVELSSAPEFLGLDAHPGKVCLALGETQRVLNWMDDYCPLKSIPRCLEWSSLRLLFLDRRDGGLFASLAPNVFRLLVTSYLQGKTEFHYDRYWQCYSLFVYPKALDEMKRAESKSEGLWLADFGLQVSPVPDIGVTLSVLSNHLSLVVVSKRPSIALLMNAIEPTQPWTHEPDLIEVARASKRAGGTISVMTNASDNSIALLIRELHATYRKKVGICAVDQQNSIEIADVRIASGMCGTFAVKDKAQAILMRDDLTSLVTVLRIASEAKCVIQ